MNRLGAVARIALGPLIVLGVAFSATSAASAEGVAFWSVQQTVAPRYIPPGGEGVLIVTATDLGDAPVEGGSVPVTLSDVLPEGLTATAVESDNASCTVAPLVCTLSEALPVFEPLQMLVHVTAAAGPAVSLSNEIKISGGDAKTVTVREPLSVGSQPATFGVEDVELQAFNEDGSFDTQAGGHPFELTSTLDLNEALATVGGSEGPIAQPAAMAKDLRFQLPPGLVGNPQAIPQCTETQFTSRVGSATACADDTVIGVATVRISGLFSSLEASITLPVYNLAPNVGEPARFGFAIGIANVRVYLDTSVRTGGDYGVTVSVNNISQIVGFAGSQVTFWGVPGDPRHDSSRGPDCLMGGLFGDHLHSCGEQAQRHGPIPFLTLPTSCEAAWQTSVQGDSWAEPEKALEASYTLHDSLSPQIGMDGCNRLPFEPSISVVPDGQTASTPTGLTVGIHVPQQAALNATGISEADVRNTTVALPQGVVLNPAAADGLQACATGQVGFERIDSMSQTNLFTPGGVSCPEESKVGTVQVETPLLPDPLEGAVYLAAQNANPFGSLLALYIVAEDPTAGVLVKLAGEVVPDPVTGQLVSTFKNTPQLPFEDLHLKFFGTARAPLNTPALCGLYTTRASIAPWSGNAAAEPSSSFQITSGPYGSPCSNPLPFAPSLTSGMTNINAGAFSALTTTISREDGNQSIQTVQLHMPPGVSGILTGVKLCPEAQADAGTCGPESLIGHTIVSVGLGGDPYTVSGGEVFLTESYRGAQFGLSIVNPAKAGPFDLGKVVVRARIDVNPLTAQLTITTDADGPYAIPHILDGIPLQIKHVNVTIDRPGFTFNPTNCNPMAITGMIGSVEGSSAQVAVPFQVTNCATLKFAPKFSVSTSAKTSKANGSSSPRRSPSRSARRGPSRTSRRSG